ncbi:MAG: DUF1080 domain-containing protein [Bacteroidota bacterium]
MNNALFVPLLVFMLIFGQSLSAATNAIPDDQKLLSLRKDMEITSSLDEQLKIIKAIGELNTFLSIVYLEKFLDNPKLSKSAAQAIIKIAIPDSPEEKGFTGKVVSDILIRTSTIIPDEDARISKYLAEISGEVGYVSMFNGKNLDGWQGLVENPIARSKMSHDELREKQKEANEKMTENWSVRDGMIIFNGKGHNLCSVKDYKDFELVVDWKITKGGDSGLYLRGTPQVQIWDIARVESGAQVGSGGLYNNQINESKPLKVADNPVGEWNTFRVSMIGENVTVYLNGELVVDNVPLENYWDRNQPIFEKGPIELQAHGNELAFRDIYVKEINQQEIGLSKEEIEEGYKSLFNGLNLEGWTGNTTDYFVEDGNIVLNPDLGGSGNLYTDGEFSDFVFRFEFQLTPGANNGLGIRAPLEGDAAYQGMEIQIIDNSAPKWKDIHDYQKHGSVYGVIPAKVGYLKPVGEWNEEEVWIKGSKIRVTLNGNVIVDGDILKASKKGTIDKREHPGLKNEKGHIGFLGHGDPLKFRNIRIKELTE